MEEKEKKQKKKPNKIKSYDIQDILKRVPDSQWVVDERTFGRIVKQYFKNMVDALIQYSEVTLPHHAGTIRLTIVDTTPYYDVKTGTVHGGNRKPAYYTGNTFCVDKFVRISYYRGFFDKNPFYFFQLKKGKYFLKRIGEIYKTRQFNSRFTK